MCNTTCNRKRICFIRKKTENHSTLDPTVFRWVLQCEIQREETAYFFSQSEHKGHWDECETILLNKVVTWKALYLVAIKSYRWFNSIFKKYGENRFRSIFHIRRNIRISSTVSYFNILLSVIFQLCLLSNKESFFQDMRCFSTSERIPVRITCNSRHTLLYYLYV